MAKRHTLTDHLLNEVILYAGIPLRRRDVYVHALKTYPGRGLFDTADYAAFKPTAVEGVEPWTLEAFEVAVAAFEGPA